MRVLVQIGYSKSGYRRREGQKLTVLLNDEELSFDGGMYLTSRVDTSRGFCWYLRELDVEPGDVIHIKCATALVGLGSDPARIFSSLYCVDENAPVREIEMRGVGKRGYPIIKGRIVEMASVSEQDERESEIQNFMKDGF